MSEMKVTPVKFDGQDLTACEDNEACLFGTYTIGDKNGGHLGEKLSVHWVDFATRKAAEKFCREYNEQAGQRYMVFTRSFCGNMVPGHTPEAIFLNLNPITSGYMTSYKYIVYRMDLEDKEEYYCYRTKTEATEMAERVNPKPSLPKDVYLALNCAEADIEGLISEIGEVSDDHPSRVTLKELAIVLKKYKEEGK